VVLGEGCQLELLGAVHVLAKRSGGTVVGEDMIRSGVKGVGVGDPEEVVVRKGFGEAALA